MVFIGSDHAGFKCKEYIKKFLDEYGEEYIDFGNTEYDPDDDYTDFGYTVAKQVIENEGRGLLFCGNAEGICMVANKVKGIRAAIGYNEYAARTSREDDDSNILCLPGRVLTYEEAKQIVKVWLETPFSNEERHKRRLAKMKKIEELNE